MKYRIIYIQFLLGLMAVFIKGTSIYAQQSHEYGTRIWYTKPSINWNEALPIGNGRLGAMIYGGVHSEHIQLNEQTLWSGGPGNWNNPNAKKYLPQVREAALAGKYSEADSLARFMQGPYTESYLPLADLYIQMNYLSDSTNYMRELNIDSAISNVKFRSNGVEYNRTAFSSNPGQVIVIRQEANKPAAVSFTAMLNSKLRFSSTVISKNHIVLKGKCPKHVEPAYLWKIPVEQAVQYSDSPDGEGMNFEVHMLIRNEKGSIEAKDNSVIVTGADAADIIISASTSWNGFDHSPGKNGIDPSVKANKYLNSVSSIPYNQLKKEHVADYQKIFRRYQLYLGSSKNNNLPTDERLRQMASYTDPELVSTIVQYGRYILIAGSRPGGQPVNLKGIWNDRLRPEYSSNWCIDHDAQMFYYAVETSNLSEMHQPFLQFISDLSVNGAKTASINYGMRGWCAHHNADIWRQSAPVGNWGSGNPHWANWNMSGPWLSAHFFEHYQFTGDKKFLREKAWPVMKGAALFCLDWLIKDANGKLISVPSVSPENTFITADGDTAEISVNTTSDIALIKELFTNCIQTASILNVDADFKNQLKESLVSLQPYRTGSLGQLLEWSDEWRPMDPSHRHLSHMYPVFPGSEISPALTPGLSSAAKKALSLRQKTNCSWGFAWKAACWARLGEPDSAWNEWQSQLRYVDPKSTSSINNYGLFPNLFNSDGRDVIMNGNGCATAVMTEMLLQSHTGAIQFLPALPKQFQSGLVKGIVARGGFEVDVEWRDNALVKAVIRSRLGNGCRIRSVDSILVYENGKKVLTSNLGNVHSFKTTKGKLYTVIPQEKPEVSRKDAKGAKAQRDLSDT